jgi:hypothetical protein
MGNTPNNNFPFPESTDLVKDGAQAIEDLADAIDTTLGVYAPSTSGLTLINTTSFSGVSSQSVNDVFSATYKNYRVLVNFDSNSAGAFISMRLRVAGADNTTTNYAHTTYKNAMGSTSFAAYTRTADGNTFFRILTEAQTETSTISYDVFNPFNSEFAQINGTGTNNQDTFGFGGSFNATTSFTGFTLIPNNGTITGTITVMGYNA